MSANPQYEDVYQWSIYCDTDSKWVTGWGAVPPATCYENVAHTVSTTKKPRRHTTVMSAAQITQTASLPNITNKTRLWTLQLKDDTTGSEWLPGNATTVMTWVSPPYPMALAGMTVAPGKLQENDYIDMWMGKYTVVGVLMAPLAEGDSIMTLSGNAHLLFTGMEIGLKVGSTIDELGEIYDVKTSTQQVKSQNAATKAYSAYTTYVVVSERAAANLHLGVRGEGGGVVYYGQMSDGSQVIPPSTVCTLHYTNTHPQPERLAVTFEYQYGSQNLGTIP